MSQKLKASTAPVYIRRSALPDRPSSHVFKTDDLLEMVLGAFLPRLTGHRTPPDQGEKGSGNVENRPRKWMVTFATNSGATGKIGMEWRRKKISARAWARGAARLRKPAISR
jgi:hypothetical protein